VTPTLSVDGTHETVIDVCVDPVTVRAVGVVGGVVSAHALVDAVSEVLAERLPAASYASTASG
jgi:hypothetical protein